jgi:uncharacterized membrane protein YphA (DoxX/SURF4 family)
MSLSAKIRRAPVRAATGAYILSSGFDKIQAGGENLKGVHAFTADAYPVFQKVDPKLFTRGLGVAEMTLGAALLLPVVPPLAAGVGLVAFSGALLGIYWRTPALHRSPTDPRPTQDGMALAKDSWMFGIGTGLIADAMLSGAHDARIRVTDDVAKMTAVGKERARGRSKEAKARVREARASARAMREQAMSATAKPRARAGMYVGAAKGVAEGAKGVASGAKNVAQGAKDMAATVTEHLS